MAELFTPEQSQVLGRVAVELSLYYARHLERALLRVQVLEACQDFLIRKAQAAGLLVDEGVRSTVAEYGAACAVEATLASDVFRQELAQHARDLEAALSGAVDAPAATA
jgi:hypothetical protein